MHIKKVLDNAGKKLNQIHRVSSNRNISLSTRRLLLLSVIVSEVSLSDEVNGTHCLYSNFCSKSENGFSLV